MIQVRHTEKIGAEGLAFYLPNLLRCPDQMLAVMELSQHLVSTSQNCQTHYSSRCPMCGHGLFCLKRILNVLRKQNALIYGRLSVTKSSLFLWKQGVNFWFDTIADRLFENLVGDAEQRDGTVALWILYRF